MDNHITKKIENSSRADIISNLPSNIIDNILICLPINEAVKTSILSKKWRFMWRYIPKLIFDKTFYQTSVVPYATQQSITKLFLIIYKVLLLHHGPILNFTFHVPLLEIYPEINQLMLYLSEKDVREIFFEINGGSIYRTLPSYLFSCVTLRDLTLSSCSFTVPLAFQGFVKLISLTFDSVDINTDVFGTFISKCPLLERLSIKGCTQIENLDINIPYLKFFRFSGSFQSLCLRKSKHLSTVIFDEAFPERETSKMIELLESLPVLNQLCLGINFLDCLMTMPRKLATLSCLRVLELPDVCFACSDEVSVVLWLIMSSPNLEKLEIGFSHHTNGASLATELLEVKDLLDNALKKLRVVKMKLPDTKTVKPELEFIKFLLAESEALEKMFIQSASANRTVAPKILTEMIRFQRSSKKAEIVYLDP